MAIPILSAVSSASNITAGSFTGDGSNLTNVPGGGGGSNPSWYGNLYGAYGRCDPQLSLRLAQFTGSIAATPTNIAVTIARIAYFRPPANITVNKIRFFGVGA